MIIVFIIFIISLNKIIRMSEVSKYVNHSLNTSQTKAAFSFPRQGRLLDNNKAINHSFYDLPSVRNNRACSLGYGNKTDLANKSFSPPPGAYNLKSLFNQTNKASAIGFGKSRQQIKFGSFIQDIQKVKNLPAPNRYRISLSTLNKKGGRIATRLPSQLDIKLKVKIPGPGTYDAKHINMCDSGAFFLSNFKNNLSPRYHNPQNQHRQSKRLKTVGPCSYQTMNKQFGKSILSKFRNSVAGTFPKSQRQGIVQKGRLLVPGSKYHSFSQFGQIKD